MEYLEVEREKVLGVGDRGSGGSVATHSSRFLTLFSLDGFSFLEFLFVLFC